MRDNENRTQPIRGRRTSGAGIPAVGPAPKGGDPFMPSREEHEAGIRAAARANEESVIEEFRRFPQGGE